MSQQDVIESINLSKWSKIKKSHIPQSTSGLIHMLYSTEIGVRLIFVTAETITLITKLIFTNISPDFAALSCFNYWMEAILTFTVEGRE